MRKPPAFQFYADDFIAGTAILSTEEVGAYILLLCHQWNCGSLPDNDILIRRIARLTQAFDLANLRSKFKAVDGVLKNDRMERERDKQMQYREKQAKNGKMGGRPITQALVEPKPSQSSPSPSPLIDSKKGFQKPTIAQARAMALEQGLPEVEGDRFWYFYDSKGWKVGKQSMKSAASAFGGWAYRVKASGSLENNSGRAVLDQYAQLNLNGE